MVKIGLFGPQGAGKTTLAMTLARTFQQVSDDIVFYTNVNATGKNLVVIKDLDEIPMKNGKPKVFYLDEAMFSIDARNSNSKQNKIWSKALALFRKGDIVLAMFGTHRPGMLDVRVRDQLDYVLMCRKNKAHFDYLLYDTLSKMTSPLLLPKTKQVFEFADFDTKDHPDPILIEQLVLNNPRLFMDLK